MDRRNTSSIDNDNKINNYNNDYNNYNNDNSNNNDNNNNDNDNNNNSNNNINDNNNHNDNNYDNICNDNVNNDNEINSDNVNKKMITACEVQSYVFCAKNLLPNNLTYSLLFVMHSLATVSTAVVPRAVTRLGELARGKLSFLEKTKVSTIIS